MLKRLALSLILAAAAGQAAAESVTADVHGVTVRFAMPEGMCESKGTISGDFTMAALEEAAARNKAHYLPVATFADCPYVNTPEEDDGRPAAWGMFGFSQHMLDSDRFTQADLNKFKSSSLGRNLDKKQAEVGKSLAEDVVKDAGIDIRVGEVRTLPDLRADDDAFTEKTIMRIAVESESELIEGAAATKLLGRRVVAVFLYQRTEGATFKHDELARRVHAAAARIRPE